MMLAVDLSFMGFVMLKYDPSMGFLGGAVVKNPPAIAGDAGEVGLIPGLGRSPGRRTPVFLPGKFHGQRSLAGRL